jgi:hypothetical protein
MTSLRLFFLLTLVASLVLAAPAPARRAPSTLKKRSFKVPRSLNKNHPRGLNGYDAMKKVALKYNLASLKEGYIASTKTADDMMTAEDKPKINAAQNATNGTGEVAANPEENAALFLSPVTIGGQTLNLDFDTGSSDL